MNRFRLTGKGMIAIVLMLVLLAGAIYLNIRLGADGEGEKTNTDANAQHTGDENDTPNGTGEGGDAAQTSASAFPGFFEDFRSERSNIRAQEIEYLRMIISDETTDKETLASAQQRLMELVSNMEQEFSIESKIRAKGFSDAAVTFRNDSVTVVIDGEELSDEEVARILDIIRTETGAPASAVRISLSRGSV